MVNLRQSHAVPGHDEILAQKEALEGTIDLPQDLLQLIRIHFTRFEKEK